MPTPTADLYDAHGEDLQVLELQLQSYGHIHEFEGTVETISCHEDHALLTGVLEEEGAGEGKVLVVDGGGSLHAALLGDLIAQAASDNGWQGVVINGAVRDSTHLVAITLGVKALGVTPRWSGSTGAGEHNVPVTFGGVTFRPGAHLSADGDGIVVTG